MAQRAWLATPLVPMPANAGTGGMSAASAGSAGAASAAVGCSSSSASSAADGCCPEGANSNVDPDCTATCGNGATEKGETCDPASSCPSVCIQTDACVTTKLEGDPSLCTAKCSVVPVTACVGGDKCCPEGCIHPTDADCSKSCGDGTSREVCAFAAEAGGMCMAPCPSGACQLPPGFGNSTKCVAEPGWTAGCLIYCSTNADCPNGVPCQASGNYCSSVDFLNPT